MALKKLFHSLDSFLVVTMTTFFNQKLKKKHSKEEYTLIPQLQAKIHSAIMSYGDYGNYDTTIFSQKISIDNTELQAMSGRPQSTVLGEQVPSEPSLPIHV